MQYSSRSSSTASSHAAPLVCAPQMRFMMGPFSMADDGAAQPKAVTDSEGELLTSPSAFAPAFDGAGGAAHPAQRETGLREVRDSETGYQQGAASAAELYEYAGGAGVSGASRGICYGSPSGPVDAVRNASAAALGFNISHFGPAHRTNSAATSGTALSECHLSRKDGGGFTSVSARTFLKSDDSFGDRSETSRLSLHDSLVTPASYLSGPVQESVGSAYYLDTTYGESEQDHVRVTYRAESAGVVSVAQRQLSNSAHVRSHGAASLLSSKKSFSMIRQADLSMKAASSSPSALHTQSHHQRPEYSLSQNGNLAPPRKRSTTEGDSQRATVSSVSSASGSFENGFGPTGCSPFYDLSTIATEGRRAVRRPSAASDRDDAVSTGTAASRSGSSRLPSTQRSTSGRWGSARPSGSASVSSTSSIVTAGSPRQRSHVPKMMSTASAESRETASSHGSVNTSKSATGPPSPSTLRKPRRKDPRKLNHSRPTSVAAAHSVENVITSPSSSASPVTPVRNTNAHKLTTTSSPFAKASPASYAKEDKGRCHTAVASQPPPPLRQQGSPTSAPSGPTPTFTVAPPSHDERHPRPFLRRRYLRGHVVPLSATDIQMTMVPFSPRRDVPPSRNTLRGPSPQTPAKTAVPLPPSQHDVLTLPCTAQAWSPSVTASNSASFSVTPDRFATVASSPGARRTQQRVAGLAGFHVPIGIEGLYVAAENSNERSLRSLGVRSGTELRMLGESSNAIMSRSCPSVEYSADEGTNPFLIQRSSSWSVHSARSTTDSSEVTGIARKKRQTERMLSTAQEAEEEYVTIYSNPLK